MTFHSGIGREEEAPRDSSLCWTHCARRSKEQEVNDRWVRLWCTAMQHEELLHPQDVSFLQLLARKCMKNETNWTGMTMYRSLPLLSFATPKQHCIRSWTTPCLSRSSLTASLPHMFDRISNPSSCTPAEQRRYMHDTMGFHPQTRRHQQKKTMANKTKTHREGMKCETINLNVLPESNSNEYQMKQM